MRVKLGTASFLLWILAGCAPSATPDAYQAGTAEQPVVAEELVRQRLEPFLAALADAGATAAVERISPESLFAAPMVQLLVDEEEVTVYPYQSVEARQAVSEQLSPDAAELVVSQGAGDEITTVHIDWADTAHFWADAHLIIQYVGQNPDLVNMLDGIYGPQVAESYRPYQPDRPGTGRIGGFGPLGDAAVAGISLQYDAYLLYSAHPSRLTAEPAGADGAVPTPEHIAITLTGDKFPPSNYLAQIIISAEPFPVLEWPGGELVSAAKQPLTFQNGDGFRWLAQEKRQDLVPINNADLLYLFSGKSFDEHYFVYATIPVGHPELPNSASEAVGPEALSADWDVYLERTQTMLNNQPPDSFFPHLTTIDEMLETLLVEPTMPLAGLAE